MSNYNDNKRSVSEWSIDGSREIVTNEYSIVSSSETINYPGSGLIEENQQMT